MNKLISLAGLSLAIGFSSSASAIIITTTDDASVLASTLLGSGIAVSNSTYSGGTSASGTFTDGLSSGIGMDTGIILTTGSASNAVGPNSSPDTTSVNGSASDPDLASIASGSVFDATFLSLDFTSTGGDVFFNYVFASEEYLEYVNAGVNDTFGLFLDGVNLSNIPGTSDPVSIDTVNDAVNSAYFNDNVLAAFDIEYDGFTDIFTASFLGLSAGSHTLKFAIGDVGDDVLDSAVFIQAGTLSDTNPNTASVPEPTSLALLGLGLAGFGFSRKKKKA